jgi:hypothetical protein
VAPFNQHNCSGVYPCHLYQQFIPFNYRLAFHRLIHPKLFICSPVEHVGVCFQLGAIANKASMNIHSSLDELLPSLALGRSLGTEWLDHRGGRSLTSYVVLPFYFLTSSV